MSGRPNRMAEKDCGRTENEAGKMMKLIDLTSKPIRPNNEIADGGGGWGGHRTVSRRAKAPSISLSPECRPDHNAQLSAHERHKRAEIRANPRPKRRKRNVRRFSDSRRAVRCCRYFRRPQKTSPPHGPAYQLAAIECSRWGGHSEGNRFPAGAAAIQNIACRPAVGAGQSVLEAGFVAEAVDTQDLIDGYEIKNDSKYEMNYWYGRALERKATISRR